MRIARDKDLAKLTDRIGNGMVKIVTGIRRCGKSYLLFNIFKDHLLDSGVLPSRIVTLALDQRENRAFRDPDELLGYVKSRIKDQERHFVLLDEIQMARDFEEVLNSLLHIGNVEVFVTGSNSKFLSKDIITEFRGRGDEVRLHPLTFKEVMGVSGESVERTWGGYVLYGGLPAVVGMKSEEQKVEYLTRLFEETCLRDIVERRRLGKADGLAGVASVLASSVGSLVSPGRLASTFQSVLRSPMSANTIRQYIEYLEDAFIVNKAERYDVKGRRRIGAPLKYYFEDIGLRNARLGFRQTEENHLMENIIYNELRSRGYSVDVGLVEKRETKEGVWSRKRLEVDFVCNLGSKRYYIQSAFSIPTDEKRAQEKASLLGIGDSFKKIVIVRDDAPPTRDWDGITTMGIFDFLLNENSLEL